MLVPVFVIACVATLAQNVVHSTSNRKLNESVEVTTTSTEPDLQDNANSTTAADIDFLFDEPEAPTVSAVVSPVTFGTNPHWVHETQTLYYVSVFGMTLMRYADGSHFKSKLSGMPTFIIPIEGKENRFAVGLGQKVVEIQWEGGLNGAVVLRTITEVHMEHPEDRFSHGKADPKGRLFAGSMSHNYNPARTNKASGALYRFAEDGTPQKVVDNIDVANGFCWDLAQKAFYFIDNFNYSIRRYQYDVETGQISNPRIVFAMQDQEYIVANPRTSNQDITQDDFPYDSLELSNPGSPLIGREGNTRGDEDGSQSLEIEKNIGGLLDRDDYYEGTISSASEDDGTYDSKVAPPGGPGYVEGGPQNLRQGDLQGFAHGGPQGASQSYAASSPQDYSQNVPEINVQGGPEAVAPEGPEGDAPEVTEANTTTRNDDDAPDGTPAGPQGYVQTGQIGRQKLSQRYARGGPKGHAPGSPQGYALTPQAPGRRAYAPRDHAPVGPGILRTATVPDYYSQDLAQDVPPDGPESNNNGNIADYVRYGSPDQKPGGPQDYARNAPQDYGPKDSHGFAPADLHGSVRTKKVEKDSSFKKKLSGTLDGMTIDTEGYLWVANYNGSQVLKIDPKTGKLLLVIPIGTLLVTSVTFGGPNLEVLYVTSAAIDSMEKKEQRSPAGATFSVINPGAKGHPDNNVKFKSITRSSNTKDDQIKDLT